MHLPLRNEGFLESQSQADAAVLTAASLLAGVGVTAACMAAAGATTSVVGSASLAAANLAAAHAAAEGLVLQFGLLWELRVWLLPA
jgi:hypothetical protein